MVCGENVSVFIRVKEMCKELDERVAEAIARSAKLRNKLEKCLLLRKLERQAELVRFC